MMQNFMQNFARDADKFGRHALTGTALVGASYLSSCAPEEPDPGFGVEVMHGDIERFGSVIAFGDPHGGSGAFIHKGEKYTFTVNRRNPGQENATIHFPNPDVVNEKHTQVRLRGDLGVERQIVVATGNDPYTMTITFNDKATRDENQGVEQIVLKAGQNSELTSQWDDEHKATEQLENRELFKNNMRKMMMDYNNFKDQGHLPVRVVLRKPDGPAL